MTVLTGKRIGIRAEYSGKVYSLARLEARPKAAGEIKVRKKREYKKVAESHPWRNGYKNSFRGDRSNPVIVKGLFDSSLAWNPDNQ